jgi:hypothetical protein
MVLPFFPFMDEFQDKKPFTPTVDSPKPKARKEKVKEPDPPADDQEAQSEE